MKLKLVKIGGSWSAISRFMPATVGNVYVGGCIAQGSTQRVALKKTCTKLTHLLEAARHEMLHLEMQRALGRRGRRKHARIL